MELTKEFDKLEKGSHICSICRTSAEAVSSTVPFLLRGLVGNERCVAIVSDEIKDALKSDLKKRGIDLGRCQQQGQLVFQSSEEAYLKDGDFDGADTMKLFSDTNKQAIKDGFSGLRVVGEAHGILKGVSSIDHLFEYEAKVNNLIKNSTIIALCLYSETIFGKELLLKTLYTHPRIIIHGVVRDNPFYLSPHAFAIKKFDRHSADKYDQLSEVLLSTPSA